MTVKDVAEKLLHMLGVEEHDDRRPLYTEEELKELNRDKGLDKYK